MPKNTDMTQWLMKGEWRKKDDLLLTKTFQHSWSVFFFRLSFFHFPSFFPFLLLNFFWVFWVPLPAAVYHNFVDLLSAKSNNNNNNNNKSSNREGKIKKGRTGKQAAAPPNKKVSFNKNFAK